MNGRSNGRHPGGAAIVAEGVSKQYHIGLKEKQPTSLLQSAVGWLGSPVANYRRLRRLGQVSADGAEDIIWALRDVSFTIDKGEVVGIIGRNGAGKSTLLKILSRITPPSAGRVTLHGRVSSLLEVGTGFHPELTGRENVYLNGTILGMRKAEVDRKFDEIVSFAEVEKFIDTPVKRYSSGMRVRLAFAVSAHLESEILLVDEVLAVGDAAFQEKCLQTMDGVARVGRTVLLVSHNMQVIQRLCRRALLIEGGRLAASGAPAEVIETYLQAYTRDPLPEPLSLKDQLRLNRIQLIQDNYEVGEFIDNRKPLQIRLGYDVLTPLKNLLLGFDVFSSDGAHIYRTYDMLATGLDSRAPGAYESTYELPANALQPGHYYIELIAGVHRHGWLSKGDIRLRLNFNGPTQSDVHFLGIMGPIGAWQVERVVEPSRGEWQVASGK
ncbi:ABC transporter ATP-binding protein [Promineifilum sp.]|uniref:ABC transporter ATP-binding protein n=1 Tax=Promineifilum sp. TaxID=2664178 RepID=UPI0035B42A95